MTGAIVVFSGMDGAGKSTQIELLRSHLSANDKEPVVLWSRGGYTPGMNWLKSLLRSLLRKGPSKSALPAAGPSQARTQAFTRPLVRKVWLSLAIIDLLLLYGVWLRWKKLRGQVVICDRFLDDTALDFELNFPTETVPQWLLWRMLEKFTPTPNAAFLLTIPVKESKRRSIEKQEPFPDSEETLEKRLSEYETWAQRSVWHTLDGMKSREALADEIRNALGHVNALSPA